MPNTPAEKSPTLVLELNKDATWTLTITGTGDNIDVLENEILQPHAATQLISQLETKLATNRT